MIFSSIAYANEASTSVASGSFPTQLMPLIFIIAIFYFIVILPQNKKAKKHAEMISSVKKGDSIVVVGGVFGKVVKVDSNNKDVIYVNIGSEEEVVIKILRSSINEVSDSDSKKEPIKPSNTISKDKPLKVSKTKSITSKKKNNTSKGKIEEDKTK